MSRVFTRSGGGRGPTGNNSGGNNNARNAGSRGSNANSGSGNQRDRDWTNQEQENFEPSSLKETSPAPSSTFLTQSSSSGNFQQPQPNQQQNQQQQQNNYSQQQQGGNNNQHTNNSNNRDQQNLQTRHQPSRALYQPKPRGNSERGGGRDQRGGGGGGQYNNYDSLQNKGDRDNSNRQGNQKQGSYNAGPRNDQRQQQHPVHQQKRPVPGPNTTGQPGAANDTAVQPQQPQQQTQQRGYDPVSSRETSSIDTNDGSSTGQGPRNDEGSGGSQRGTSRDPKENLVNQFPKVNFGNPPPQGGLNPRRDQKPDPNQHNRGTSQPSQQEKRDRESPNIQAKPRADQHRQSPAAALPQQQHQQQQSMVQNQQQPQTGISQQQQPKPRMDQNRQQHQNTFSVSDTFSKSLDEVENDEGGMSVFTRSFKNGGHMGNLLQHSSFDENPMNMYSQKSRYLPGMGDFGHQDKNDRSFESSSHDNGDIFSGKDVFWRGADREEKRDMFIRDEPSPVIANSMIWSNQSSTTSLPHSQADSSRYVRPLVSGPFGLEHGAFTTNLGSSSVMDPSHLVDSVSVHQRLMQQHTIPMSPFLSNTQMPERMLPGADRMGPMFSQQPLGGGLMQPIRMGFHPQPHFSDSFMQPNMNREQGRTPLQQQQQQQQQSANGFGQQNPVLGNIGASLAVQPAQTRSPQTIAPVQTPDKNWGWEEKSAAPEPEPQAPPKPVEPVEDLGEFKVPSMKGPKTFENICSHVEELKKAIQERLKEHINKPHPERFGRVEHLCYALWNAVRDAILLDSVQACDKSRELDKVAWRDGFYPIFEYLRDSSKAPNGTSVASIEEALKVFIRRGLKFYQDLIPKVLHLFGGSVTPHNLVKALTARGRGAPEPHTLITLQLAERLHFHMGDVYRYSAELPHSDTTNDLRKAKECYEKARLLSPYQGAPHARLAMIAKRQKEPLEATFHALCSMSVKIPSSSGAGSLSGLLTSIEKTYETKKWAEDKMPNWSDMSPNDLKQRFRITFLAFHSALYHNKIKDTLLATQGIQILGMLDAVLNQSLSLRLRDDLLQMMAINLCRLHAMQPDTHGQAFLLDLSFNMFDIILIRLLSIFESAPDLDSANHLEDTNILSPSVKVFVEWIQSSYQKWFPLSPSLLSAPKDTKRLGMWTRLVSLVNLSLTLHVAGVSEERFQDSQPEKLHEDLFLAGMENVHPTLTIFYRETRLHEAIAEPRFRFKKMQSLGPVLLSSVPPVARLQWNRFLPTEAFMDKNVKALWAPLEPPPSQPKLEPLPTLMDQKSREVFAPVVSSMPPMQLDRQDTARGWKTAQAPVNEAAEHNWPSLGQSSKLLTEERRERARTASTNSTGTEDGASRGTRNGDSYGNSGHESSRSSVDPWWLLDKRLRSNDSVQLKSNGPDPAERKAPRLEESSKLYYLVDTNCLIDYLGGIEKKVMENDDLVILVPGTVYRELYKLHTNKNLKAHNALSFISDSMEHHKGRVLVITAKGEQIPHAQLAKREMVAERGSNDDVILKTCLTLQEKGLVNPDGQREPSRRGADYGSWRGTLYLLTSDTNMRLKAKKEDIYCAPVNEVLEK
ncbi:hypothetical protein RvY_14529 [Ramazzottius varieornatus]|uniref:PIN domain-containing protein n=1 Tax=Ramazzottius varieornatus TaxID=947166 RepID=A0A1D1VRM1_RAMVA|nr:hypothetical protein RvY_14529 [Ramazzottius varieornatus]